MAKSKSNEKSEPMDASAPEVAVGTPATNHKRVVGAAKTLIAEVGLLFPGVTYEVTNYDGRNAAHDVQFLMSDDEIELADLLMLVKDDERVHEVIDDGEGVVLVSIVMNPRTQDIRDPFNLDKAWDVLTEDVVFEGGSADETSDDDLDGGGA